MLFGPDLSRYQTGIDIGRVAAEGYRFLIGKVSEGATWRDSSWPAFREAATRAGLLLLGYHMITGDSPAAQAANCKTALGNPNIPLALDWEALGGSGDWPNFLRVLQAFRAAGLRVVLGYCPKWYWAQQGSPDMSAAGIPLWSSRYVNAAAATPSAMYPQVTQAMWAGYGNLPVALLQFTDKAVIAGKQVDCNAYPGTEQQLRQLLGLEGDDVAWTHAEGAPTIPDFYPGAKGPLPDPATALAWATVHAAIARDAANTANNKLDALKAELDALRDTVSRLQTPAGDPAAFATAVAVELANRLKE